MKDPKIKAKVFQGAVGAEQPSNLLQLHVSTREVTDSQTYIALL